MQTATAMHPGSNTDVDSTVHDPYARAIARSKQIRWEIERDVFRGQELDFTQAFLPAGLSKLDELPFLSADDRRHMSQIQGRSYVNIFGLVERFISAKVLELSGAHWLGDQTALEALVRFSDEELKHQEMFRRIDEMIGSAMRPGYRFLLDANSVAAAVLARSTWAVLALTCHIELFTQSHYRESLSPDPELSPLFKDVFLFHWKEESQHAILDELEWRRVDSSLSASERDRAVDEFIELVGAVDGLLQTQSAADADYFLRTCAGGYQSDEVARVQSGVLGAYRWQYILSGAQHPRFLEILGSLITAEQGDRIGRALAPLLT